MDLNPQLNLRNHRNILLNAPVRILWSEYKDTAHETNHLVSLVMS